MLYAYRDTRGKVKRWRRNYNVPTAQRNFISDTGWSCPEIRLRSRLNIDFSHSMWVALWGHIKHHIASSPASLAVRGTGIWQLRSQHESHPFRFGSGAERICPGVAIWSVIELVMRALGADRKGQLLSQHPPSSRLRRWSPHKTDSRERHQR